MANPFPPVRRIVTGHSPDGKAVFASIQPKPVDIKFVPDSETSGRFADLFCTEQFPNSNTGDFADVKPKGLVSPGGSTLRMIDMPPGCYSFLHRTVSLDYMVVVKGTVTLILDDAKREVVNEGDVVVQRGTIHAWHNDSQEWNRMFFVMLESKPVEVDGKSLPEENQLDFKP